MGKKLPLKNKFNNRVQLINSYLEILEEEFRKEEIKPDSIELFYLRRLLEVVENKPLSSSYGQTLTERREKSGRNSVEDTFFEELRTTSHRIFHLGTVAGFPSEAL